MASTKATRPSLTCRIAVTAPRYQQDWYRFGVPTEAEVQALLATAEATRKKPGRGMWIVAIVLAVVCVGALAYGLVTYWDEPAEETPSQVARGGRSGGGFVLGLVIGVAAGIAIGSALALRKRH